MPTLLVVNEDNSSLAALRPALARLGFEVNEVRDAEQALARLRQRPCDVVLTDLRLPPVEGTSVLRAIRRQHPSLPVIVITPGEDRGAAIAAMRDGAVDILVEPVSTPELERVVQDVLAGRTQPVLLGESAVLCALGDRIEQAARAVAPVRLAGEPGTGLVAIARVLHTLSSVAGGPFVVAQGAGMTDDSLLDQLRVADNGTLVIENVEELGPPVQSLLLRVLQDKPGTARTAEPIRVRYVVTTSRSLRSAVENGTFLDDLATRLGDPIGVPPLRERPEDMPALTQALLDATNRRLGTRSVLSPNMLRAMRIHRWPGNLVELHSTVEALVQAAGNVDAPASVAEYRVPVRREAASLTLADGSRHDGILYLPSDRDWPELLESGGHFLPFGQGRAVRLLGRGAIACLSVSSNEAHDPEVLPMIRAVAVHLTSGKSFDGELRYSPTEGRARVADFLNREPRVFAVHDGSTVHYVAKDHVLWIEEKE